MYLLQTWIITVIVSLLESLCSPTLIIQTINIELVSMKKSIMELVLICRITKLERLDYSKII